MKSTQKLGLQELQQRLLDSSGFKTYGEAKYLILKNFIVQLQTICEKHESNFDLLVTTQRRFSNLVGNVAMILENNHVTCGADITVEVLEELIETLTHCISLYEEYYPGDKFSATKEFEINLKLLFATTFFKDISKEFIEVFRRRSLGKFYSSTSMYTEPPVEDVINCNPKILLINFMAVELSKRIKTPQITVGSTTQIPSYSKKWQGLIHDDSTYFRGVKFIDYVEAWVIKHTDTRIDILDLQELFMGIRTHVHIFKMNGFTFQKIVEVIIKEEIFSTIELVDLESVFEIAKNFSDPRNFHILSEILYKEIKKVLRPNLVRDGTKIILIQEN